MYIINLAAVTLASQISTISIGRHELSKSFEESEVRGARHAVMMEFGGSFHL